jgi:cation diffusion facilitator CzcD-associated flavoprotein CzcO
MDADQGDRGRPIDPALRPRHRRRGEDRPAHIRFGHRVRRASWSSEAAEWTVHTDNATFTCAFLYMCTGYYRYDAGYLPEFPGLENYRGQVAHPQHWPENADYAGKRVVVIGSGGKGRARDHAAALAQLHPHHAHRRHNRCQAGQSARHAARIRGHSLEERVGDHL